MEVEVARDRVLWKQSYVARQAAGQADQRRARCTTGAAPRSASSPTRRSSATLAFQPGAAAIGCAAPRPICSAAWKSAGPAIPRCCQGKDDTPAEAVLHFPGGLRDILTADIGERQTRAAAALRGRGRTCRSERRAASNGRSPGWRKARASSTPTATPSPRRRAARTRPGLRTALLQGPARLGRAGAATARPRRSRPRTCWTALAAKLSVFMRDPQFQGQTKEKLTSAEAARLVETAVRDRFDHWLAGDPAAADNLLALRHRAGRGAAAPAGGEGHRAQVAPRASCGCPASSPTARATTPPSTEIFLVEGDCAGGSAKQARNRETQAVLPLRGKILNVASASADKLRQNQELKDLIEALGCGVGERVRPSAAALWARHHHDRRRRGRRPYRLAADDLLLSRAAGAGRHGHICSWRSRRCTA